VFAGYKQDFDGQPARRACEVVDDERNVVVALPSVLANAVPDAFEVVRLIRQRLGEPTAGADVQWDSGVGVAGLNEDADGTGWMRWTDFRDRYGGGIG
jgi:hypothetical protein